MELRAGDSAGGDDLIAWDPKFNTGIPGIDAEHRHLVELCNDFYQGLFKNRENENWHDLLASTLDECIIYANTHFKNEERQMLTARFDGYARHKQAHDDFLYHMELTKLRFANTSITDAIELVHFLHDWILSHIALEDKLYVPKLREFLRENQSHRQ